LEESVNGPRNLLFAIVFAFAAVSFSSATNTYFAQSAAGSANGSSCSNAKAFGSSQTGSGGNTITLCGAFTSAIEVDGSGTSGSRITVAFDCASKAQISMPAIPAIGALVLTGNYVTIDGQNCGFPDGATAASALSGGPTLHQIQSTSNGQSGFSNSIGSQAIVANNLTGVTVQNLVCGPLYLHNTTAQTTFGAPYPACVNFTGNSASATVIKNNYMTDCAWCGWGQGPSVTFSNNVCINFDHCLGMGNVNTTPTVWGPVYFYGNSMSHATTWDTGSSGQYHHDGLHLWAYCSDGGSYCAGTYWNNVYVYNNHFYGNWGAINTTAHIFFEENIHNAWVFNNWFDCTQSGDQCDSAAAYLQGTNISSVNNTLVGSGSSQPTALHFMGGPNVVNQNNVISTAQVTTNIAATDESGVNATSISALDHNVYMNGESSPWVWKANFINQLASWQAASGEKNAVYAANSTVNLPAGTLQAGSPAIGAGANLYSTCNGQPNPGVGALCSDANGNPRPTSGAWDAGAYSYNTDPPPNPPTGLTAVVN
jgi:hypothetical protein